MSQRFADPLLVYNKHAQCYTAVMSVLQLASVKSGINALIYAYGDVHIQFCTTV